MIKKDASLLAVRTSSYLPLLPNAGGRLGNPIAFTVDRAQEFVPELADLQVDASPLVRRYLAELLEEAAAAAPQPAVLQPAAACLQALCADGAATVAKRAVPAAAAVFRTCFALVAAQAIMLSPPAARLCNIHTRSPSELRERRIRSPYKWPLLMLSRTDVSHMQ